MGSTAQLQMIGCLGKHGPYTFYKSIKIGERTLSLATFMPVKIWPDSEILSLADIQLIWSDKNNESLCSLRLYFLPENTPEGKLNQHGEDEVIAVQDHIVIKASDLATWLIDESAWNWGFKTPTVVSDKSIITPLSKSFISHNGKYRVNDRLGKGLNSVVVLNYARYIRLRTVLKRLESTPDIQNWLTHPSVLAIGGLNIGPNCRILYTKEFFYCADLEDHEHLCNDMAPKLGLAIKANMKKKKNRNESNGSHSNSNDSESASDDSEKVKEKLSNGLLSNGEDIKPLIPLSSKRGNARIDNGSVMGASSNGLQILKVDNVHSRCNNSDMPSSRKRPANLNGSSRKTENLETMVGSFSSGNENESHYDDKMGPTLQQLAAKLRKSNALQILPIRPSVIKQPDSSGDADNHSGNKRIKSEHFGNDYLNAVSLKNPNSLGSSRTEANVKYGKNTCSKKEGKTILPAHSVSQMSLRNSAIFAAQNAQSPMRLRGTSPSAYAPTTKIYGDPLDIKKQKFQGLSISNSNCSDNDVVLDLTSKKVNRNKISSNRVTVNSTPKFDGGDSGLLDLSAKHQSANVNHNMYHSIASLPPPNAMNQLGLRLTSEVTLFPSQNPPNSKLKGSNSSQKSSSNTSNHSKTSVHNPHITIQQSTRSARPSSSSSGLSQLSLSLGEAAGHHQAHSSKVTSGNSQDRGQNQPSTSQKSAAGGSRERKDPENVNPITINPYFNPAALYGKMMDPATYMSLFGPSPFLMPPNAAAGLTGMPGAIEQYYKDLILRGHQLNMNMNQLPNWYQPRGHDREHNS